MSNIISIGDGGGVCPPPLPTPVTTRDLYGSVKFFGNFYTSGRLGKKGGGTIMFNENTSRGIVKMGHNTTKLATIVVYTHII